MKNQAMHCKGHTILLITFIAGKSIPPDTMTRKAIDESFPGIRK